MVETTMASVRVGQLTGVLPRFLTGKRCFILKKTCHKGGNIIATSRRWCGTHLSASQWQLVGALCVERTPVLSQESNPLEKAYTEMLQRIEMENSLLSNHELRHREDLKRAEKMKEGNIDLEDLDAAAKQTAQDFEDQASEELKKFAFASRQTGNDFKLLARRLDRSLILIPKQKLGNVDEWVLPMTTWQPGETLRQTAGRALTELLADGQHTLDVRIAGNAPVGYYRYKYPNVLRESGKIGAKVFFFKSHVVGGNVSPASFKKEAVSDYGWFARDELKDVLKERYRKSVETFLTDDDNAYLDYLEWKRRWEDGYATSKNRLDGDTLVRQNMYVRH